MNQDICDGCMNGCSLSQPGCPKGAAKASGKPVPVMTAAMAQDAYLARRERIRGNMDFLRAAIERHFQNWPENFLDPAVALRPDLGGMQLFDAPVWGVSDAFDPLYRRMKKPEAIGPWFRLPQEWLPGARRVISIFFPFSEPVRKSLRTAVTEIPPEWLHGRIEGHEAMLAFARSLAKDIQNAGARALIPALDPRFGVIMRGKGISGFETGDPNVFGSRWSERHVAYISGLGTFGLSRGIITERGMAGRFCSIVTDLELDVTPRTYQGLYDWCIRCGACVQRCPENAISLDHGKDHIPCADRINQSKIDYAPRYGCGMCQTAVPCEARRP